MKWQNVCLIIAADGGPIFTLLAKLSTARQSNPAPRKARSTTTNTTINTNMAQNTNMVPNTRKVTNIRSQSQRNVLVSTAQLESTRIVGESTDVCIAHAHLAALQPCDAHRIAKQ